MIGEVLSFLQEHGETAMSASAALGAASLALALGLALLAARRLRRLRAGRRPRRSAAFRPVLAAPAAPGEAAVRARGAYGQAGAVVPTPVATAAAAPTAPTTGERTGAAPLAALLRRLQEAGDRLEDLRGGAGERAAGPVAPGAGRVPEPVWPKAAPDGVEYVFRASAT